MARRRIELRLRAYEAQAPNHGPRDEINVGGSGGSRTRGLFDANEALFRLSYTPSIVEPPAGFEPAASALPWRALPK